MFFTLLRMMADGIAGRSVKSAVMLAGMLVLIGILLGTAWLAWRRRRKWMVAAWIVLLLVFLPQIFAFSTFLEWEDHRIEPEYVGELRADPGICAAYFVEGKNGFTLTDTPPDGTCGWGDVPLEQLDPEFADLLITEYGIDCGQYTYLFTRGIRRPRLEYSVWSNGTWYLGTKGFWRSNDEAELVSVGDPDQEDDAIYIFRFPRQYIALRQKLIETGSIHLFFINISW